MKPEFWHRRWQKNEIGFHRADTNPRLVDWWPALEIKTDSEVFVPLCGKSLDMSWLHGRGHRVTGIELSKEALQAFISEQRLPLAWHREPPFDVARGNGYQLYQGDFFQLERTHLEHIAAIYDRAALIALPPDMRADYVAHLRGITPANCMLLLITLDYPQQEMDGPPFSVGHKEVKTLFSGCDAEILAEHPALKDFDPDGQRGLTSLTERVYRITL